MIKVGMRNAEGGRWLKSEVRMWKGERWLNSELGIRRAENCHRGEEPWEHGGWAYEFSRNSDLKHVKNFNDLSALLKKKYGERFSTCHWVNADRGGARICNP